MSRPLLNSHPKLAPSSLAGRLLAAFALAALLVFGVAQPAHAATDQIDSFTARYQIGTNGVAHVQETIVYTFGESGRHGIDRFFVTREPWGQTDQDAVFGITNINVSSPTGGVPTQFSSTTFKTDGGRGAQLRLRIGDPNQTLSVSTATYVISYDLTGALRNSPDYDEFYWDVTGFDWQAPMSRVNVTVSVPGGAKGTSCFWGPVGSKTTCSSTTSGGQAVFTQGAVPAGQGVTIGVKIASGLIADNKPHLEPNGSKLSTGQKVAYSAAGIGTAALAVGSPIVGMLWYRRNGRDRRFAGLPPGTMPLPGQPAEVVANDPRLEIPVAFTPPQIPVGEAGLLIDGQLQPKDTAATIIDLAVRGVLRVQNRSKDEFLLTLLDPSRATAPHEVVLLENLFSGQPPGATADLSEPGSMLSAHQAMQQAVTQQVNARGWFTKIPSAAKTGGVGVGFFIFAGFVLFGIGAVALLFLLPLLPILITILVIRIKMRNGQRTPVGRAVCDQVEGFRKYLATAEADQLRFEEGEDIFSKYLPWAIIFDLAERWAKVCADLVAMGRLPADPPYWYYGNYNAFNLGFLTSSLTNNLATAAAPAPSTSASGTGFGGGSSFGGGGFSGGGGGGGGGGSW